MMAFIVSYHLESYDTYSAADREVFGKIYEHVVIFKIRYSSQIIKTYKMFKISPNSKYACIEAWRLKRPKLRKWRLITYSSVKSLFGTSVTQQLICKEASSCIKTAHKNTGMLTYPTQFYSLITMLITALGSNTLLSPQRLVV